jgi:adenylate cyclase
MGDTVNIAARLASAAGAGEILVTDATFANADLRSLAVERRRLTLKGKSEPVEVRVLSRSTFGS